MRNEKTNLTYKIEIGKDYFNNKTIYRLVGVNNTFVGDWYNTKEEAKKTI